MSLRCWQFGFPQASLGTIQSMFNFPNWLFEEIYLLVFVLQTIFVLNFAQNKAGGAECRFRFLLFFFFEKDDFLQWEKTDPESERRAHADGQADPSHASAMGRRSAGRPGAAGPLRPAVTFFRQNIPVELLPLVLPWVVWGSWLCTAASLCPPLSHPVSMPSGSPCPPGTGPVLHGPSHPGKCRPLTRHEGRRRIYRFFILPKRPFSLRTRKDGSSP